MTPVAEFSRAYRQHMNSAPMRAYYGSSEYFNVGYWAPQTRTIDEACGRLIAEVIQRVRVTPERVLDVGCGRGGTSRFLASRWPASSVIGADLAPYTEAGADASATERCRFVAMDACALAVPSGTVDMVVSIEAAFHFDSRSGFFREACRVLRPGGVLLLTDILFTDPSSIGNWMVRAPERPNEPREYALLLRAAGFTSIAVTDATDCCWSGFCRNWLEWMAAAAGTAGEAAVARAHAMRWQQDAVRYYLIASAVKA